MLTIAGTVWYYYTKAKDDSVEIRDEVKHLQPYQDDVERKDSTIQSESVPNSLANKSPTESTESNKTVIEIPHIPMLDPPGTATLENGSLTVSPGVNQNACNIQVDDADDDDEYIFV